MSAHTPGPWKVGGPNAYNFDEDNNEDSFDVFSEFNDIEVARCRYEIGDAEAKATALADATLTAAALVMLAALERAEDALNVATTPLPEDRRMVLKALREVRAAITKAQGGK